MPSAPVNRTLQMLLDFWIDNDIGLITAADGRDFLTTVFNYTATTDPTRDNDNVDTAGIGAFFDLGNRWLNTLTQTEWICYGGMPHFAQWVKTPTAAADERSVAWYTGYPAPLAGLPTVGSYTLQDGETIFVDSGSTPATANGPYVVHVGAWTRPPWYTSGQRVTGWFAVNVVNTRANQMGSGEPSLFMISPYSPGDVMVPWFVEATPVMIAAVGTGGLNVFGGLNIVVIGASPGPTNFPATFTINTVGNPAFLSVGLIPSTSPPPGALYVNSVTGLLTYNDPMLGPLVVQLSGGGSSGMLCTTYDIDYTNFSGPGTTQSFVFAVLPGQSFVGVASAIGDVPWSLSGGTLTQFVVEWSQDGGVTWNLFLNPFPVGHGTVPLFGLSWSGSNQYSSPDWTVPLQFRVTITGTVGLNNLTQGHGRVFFVWGTFS